jgi:hypothetical protein
MTIVPFLRGSVFEPRDIRAMSTALEDVCAILNLPDNDTSEKERLARTIIMLAQTGQRSAALLRDLALREIAYGQGEWPAPVVRAARQGAL